MIFSKIAFILFLILFPCGEIARFDLSNGIAVTLNDISLIALIFVFVLESILNKSLSKNLNKHLLKPILLFIGIGIFSLLINSKNLSQLEFLVSFLYLLRWLLYASIYFVVSSFNSSFKNKIPILLIVVGAFTVVGGYIQYFFYPALRNLYYLGWDEHLYRMFSSFLDPNFAGAFFVLLTLFNTYLLLSYFKKKDYIKTVLLFTIELLTLASIFLTYSRSAILMFLVGGLIFLFLCVKTLKKRILIACLYLSLFIIAIFILPRSFQTEGTNLLRSVSSLARIGSSQNAIIIFKDNPILGVGFNAYRYAQKKYGFIKGEDWEKSHAGAGTDNSFLFILATTGVLGIASYIYLLRSILKNRNKVLIASLFALFINAFFINSLFFPFIMEWIWILAAVTENK